MTDPAADKANTRETQQPARSNRVRGVGSARLMRRLMRDFAHVHIPLASRTRTLAELPMFMVWHQRYQKDPAHRWIRSQLEAVAATAAAA